MQQQNLKNHMRKAPNPFYTGLLLSLMVIVISFIYCKNISQSWDGMMLPALFISVSTALILIGYFARAFALKAQDRAIRAEENLRHFSMTGKLLDSRLAISQIIALRFASDEEFVALSKKAADEKLSSKQIKEEIKKWKGDYYRV